jgi:hypothetical protein
MATRIALLLLLVPAPAWAQATVNKAELRSQDRRATERQLKDQLWSIFEPVDERRGEGRPAPRRPLGSSALSSHSYAASVPGLCRIDSVTLRFAPVEDGAGNARTPVRAYGLDAAPSYHFRTPPKGWYHAVGDHARSPWDPECVGLRDEAFFGAPDDQTATDGVYAMLLARRAAADKIRPTCSDTGPFEKLSCEQLVAGFAASGVSEVERCEPTPSAECYKITDAAAQVLRVVMDRSEAVRSVEFDEMIVVGDTLID